VESGIWPFSGKCYIELSRASTKLLKASELLRGLYRGSQSISNHIRLQLFNLGIAYIDLNDFSKAIKYENLAIQIGDEIGSVQAQSETRSELARAYLFNKNLPKAQEIIGQAQQYDYPSNNFNVQVVGWYPFLAVTGGGTRPERISVWDPTGR
jgi:tetratricopeptide (TPR) repeat protein